jgi:hypothetical protein
MCTAAILNERGKNKGYKPSSHQQCFTLELTH